MTIIFWVCIAIQSVCLGFVVVSALKVNKIYKDTDKEIDRILNDTKTLRDHEGDND